jgi:trehalose synthase-fused probable maltokinase
MIPHRAPGWFREETKGVFHVAESRDQALRATTALVELQVGPDWEESIQGQARTGLEGILSAYVPERRWFGSKARVVQAVRWQELLRIPFAGTAALVAPVEVAFQEGPPDTYLLPLTVARGEQARRLLDTLPHLCLARLAGGAEGVLCDALGLPEFGTALAVAMLTGRTFPGDRGQIVAVPYAAAAAWQTRLAALPAPTPGTAEQSNTSLRFGQQLIAKVFRRLDRGTNPDLEIGRYLTEIRHFPHTPPVVAALEYRRSGMAEPVSLALLQGFVPNQGDAWEYALGRLREFYQRHADSPLPEALAAWGRRPLAERAAEVPNPARELLGGAWDLGRLLARRTAEMHLALAAETDDPAFRPTPFSSRDQRELYESITGLIGRVFGQCRQRASHLPEPVRIQAERILVREGEIVGRFQALRDLPLTAVQIRCHGDYHLGQVLYTGTDFVIIDFEGEPLRPIEERRRKRSPLRDVAGMLRSFHYAAHGAAMERNQGRLPGGDPASASAGLEAWCRFWYAGVSSFFWQAYLETARNAAFLPRDPDELLRLLEVFLLEKAIYELGYELNHRPDWTPIPLLGIAQLLPERG